MQAVSSASQNQGSLSPSHPPATIHLSVPAGGHPPTPARGPVKQTPDASYRSSSSSLFSYSRVFSLSARSVLQPSRRLPGLPLYVMRFSVSIQHLFSSLYVALTPAANVSLSTAHRNAHRVSPWRVLMLLTAIRSTLVPPAPSTLVGISPHLARASKSGCMPLLCTAIRFTSPFPLLPPSKGLGRSQRERVESDGEGGVRGRGWSQMERAESEGEGGVRGINVGATLNNGQI
uniref:Uncharacterized protein n=1 Tax=Knipowitschia caucasica TaxID=637954 RepID=A0AAV2J440_KNICA